MSKRAGETLAKASAPRAASPENVERILQQWTPPKVSRQKITLDGRELDCEDYSSAVDLLRTDQHQMKSEKKK